MFVLLGRVELEGLETDGDADLRVGVHHPGVGLDTVPSRDRLRVSQVSPESLPLGSCGLYFETDFPG